MPLSTEDALHETHRLALQNSLKKELKTPQECARYRDIQTKPTQRVDAERDAFRTRYQSRLEEAREVVLREQTGRQGPDEGVLPGCTQS